VDVLVICPASLRLNWLREARKWLVKERDYYVVDSPKEIPASANFVICNYERLGVPGLLDRKWDLLILDEAHKVKNQKAKRTKRVVGEAPRKDKERVPGLVDNVKRKLFLTGTPILNRPIELFPLLSALEPEGLGKNFFGFAKRYCDAAPGKWGWDFSGSSHLDELQIRLRESIMVRRLKKDVLTDLPAKRRQLVALAPNGCVKIVREEQEAWEEQEVMLAAARAEVDLAWASGDEDAYKAAVDALTQASRVAFSEISAMRHRVALAKVPHFLEYAQDALESTDKVVIFAHHRDVIKQLFDGLGAYGPVRVTGEDSTDHRDAAVERFQNDPTCRVIIGSIGAMGVGLTLTASSTVLFAELSWVPADVTQAEDRTHRIGQDNAVSVVHVVLDGSLDQKMADMLIQKQEVADKALDKGAEHRVDLDMKAPAIPSATGAKPRKIPTYKDATKERVLEALQYLRACCDGAFRRDDAGYSKFDIPLGYSLASQTSLSDKQTWLGLKLCNKYRRQLDGREELLTEAAAEWGKKKEKKS
jgi:SWI/SNF-related matrix-associated actin-dependent regulator 1 of chromatin subfamily A